MFLVILFFIVGALSVLLAGTTAVKAVKNKKEFGKAFPTAGLTVVAGRLFYEYKALPADSRPFPDIIGVLKGLDDEHSVDKKALIKHFNKNAYVTNSEYKFSWDGRCGHIRCDFSTYKDLHDAIEEVSRAISEKERVIAEAKVVGRGDAAKELVKALRAEAGIQMQVTRELL